jgi:hypothetical protein
MTAEPSRWDAYVGAVIRIEAPDGVFWVRPAPVTLTTGEYPDPEGRAIYVAQTNTQAIALTNALPQLQQLWQMPKIGGYLKRFADAMQQIGHLLRD